MTNLFYTPTGNPATGSEGLSALMRAEFTAIAAAFDLLPQISTTGLFSTVLAQQGSYTFTLPEMGGTLALLTDISAALADSGLGNSITSETARAETAEAGLAASIVGAQALTTSETARAEAAETVLRAAVAAETTRAEAAEAPLSGAWTSTAGAVTSLSGAITTASSTIRYKKMGSSVLITITATITTNGTGATAVAVALPFAASPNLVGTLAGREGAVSGKMIVGYINPSTSSVIILNYDNTYPGGSGYALWLSGVYESAA